MIKKQFWADQAQRVWLGDTRRRSPDVQEPALPLWEAVRSAEQARNQLNLSTQTINDGEAWPVTQDRWSLTRGREACGMVDHSKNCLPSSGPLRPCQKIWGSLVLPDATKR
jgi:hypothetical protein